MILFGYDIDTDNLDFLILIFRKYQVYVYVVVICLTIFLLSMFLVYPEWQGWRKQNQQLSLLLDLLLQLNQGHFHVFVHI